MYCVLGFADVIQQHHLLSVTANEKNFLLKNQSTHKAGFSKMTFMCYHHWSVLVCTIVLHLLFKQEILLRLI